MVKDKVSRWMQKYEKGYDSYFDLAVDACHEFGIFEDAHGDEFEIKDWVIALAETFKGE